MTRRTFTKGAALTAAAAALGGSSTALFGCSSGSSSSTTEAEDTIAWSQCNVNCGGNCIFQWHSTDGKIQYMETDNTGDDDFQARACLRGRCMRRWINSPDRLQYPMKRVGKRGEGKFEQISWDEAIQLVADKLKYTIDTYGNQAIFLIYATGMYSSTGNPSARLLNTLGGCLTRSYDYSTNQLSAVMPYMFGEQFSPYDNVHASSFTEAEANSDLVVMFGNSPAETRMGGANAIWDFARVREAVTARGGKVINIDYRLNETSAGHPDEWLPIRTGTDAALCAALVHEFIKDGKADTDFLHKYCVGYDEESMPATSKGINGSYYDYIMGTGYDMVEKTPEWAAEITQIPAATIRSLAADLENAKAPFVCQGWGPQRHTNGESTTRAICMVPIVLGKIGLPGTNTGQREAEPPTYLIGSIPAGDNAVKAVIPCYEWLNAVDHPETMTATNSGITGVDKLDPNGIKFIWNYAGNCITNQHGDINKVYEVLSDETKCEFILVWDTVMTDSAKYADLLLPDAMRSEQLNMQTQGYSEYYTGVTVGGPAQEPAFESRCSYDVMAEIADKLGKKDAFTEGRTHDDWVQYLYETGASADSKMPTWDEIKEQGVYKRQCDPAVGLKAYRDDPVTNALKTPSGKIEIYSEQLATLNSTWELEDGQVISPIPIFDPGVEGYGSVTDEFPLYCSGWHDKARTHSSFGFLELLQQANRHRMWINPADATSRGIADGDTVEVTSPAGKVQIEAHVTSRIIPGTVAMPQGHWHDADMTGDKVDKGACINTLTTYRPAPLGKGNGQAHSIIVQVAKA